MRQTIIAGNWKMYKTAAEAVEFVRDLKPLVAGARHCEIVICPPYTSLEVLAPVLAGSGIFLGAQNMFWQDEGAFTGEVSPGMLLAAGCKYVILGHSERREYFGENDETVNRKLKAALDNGLVPIFCVGEKLAEREAGTTTQVVRKQVTGGLAGIAPEAVARLVIAYEPVWAIGTGKTASSQDAEEVISFIRSVVAELGGAECAAAVRIQYGGSVKPGNAAELMNMPDIDGALVGGASLDPVSFAQIVNYQTAK